MKPFVSSQECRLQTFPDSEFPLPEIFDFSSVVHALLVSPRFPKLYVAIAANVNNASLTVYELDAAGNPVGGPKTYLVESTGGGLPIAMALALHPKLPLLYVGGEGFGGLFIFRLDSTGTPLVAEAWPVGGGRKRQLTISQDGKTMYLGTTFNGLEVIRLDVKGRPIGTPTNFATDPDIEDLRTAGLTHDLQFALGYDAIWLRRRRTRDDFRVLARWRLDADGLPVTQYPEDVPSPISGMMGTYEPIMASPLVGIPPEGNGPAPGSTPGNEIAIVEDRILVDAFGDVRVDGMTLVRGGLPRIEGRSVLGYTPIAIARGSDGSLIVAVIPLSHTSPSYRFPNYARGYKARVTVQQALRDSGEALDRIDLNWYVSHRSEPASVTVGSPSAWIDLEQDLRGYPDILRIGFEISGSEMLHLTAVFDVVQSIGGALTPVCPPLVDQARGYGLWMLVPGYSFFEWPTDGTPADPATLSSGRAAAHELLSTHAQRYVKLTAPIAIAANERPKEFVVLAEHTVARQGHLQQLEWTAKALSNMGFNGVDTDGWNGIPPDKLDSVWNGHGITNRFIVLMGMPWNFEYEAPGPIEPDGSRPAVRAKVKSSIDAIVQSRSAKYDGIVAAYLVDEPGWFIRFHYQTVASNPSYLASFHAYFESLGLGPADLGASAWSEVLPIGPDTASGGSRGRRLLAYHTQRFFAEQSVRGWGLTGSAARELVGKQLMPFANFNSGGMTYRRGPRAPGVEPNPPDDAWGGGDWFVAGDRGHMTICAEDWFNDEQSSDWGLLSDALRSAVLNTKDAETAQLAFIVGEATGRIPAGAAYKLLAFISRGAKAVNQYTWGSAFHFGNCWSERWISYPFIADAIRLLGRSERLLFPGVPEAGRVGILFPGCSRVWDPTNRNGDDYLHDQEVGFLHTALVHAGFTVDIVDEMHFERFAEVGRLSVLYVTSPHVLGSCQEQIVRWVSRGGVLVLTPSAMMRDECDDATTQGDSLLGCSRSAPTWLLVPHPNMLDATRVRTLGGAFDSLEIGIPFYYANSVEPGETVGPTPLVPQNSDVSVVARFSSGESAITVRPFQRGKVIGYAFFPGNLYVRTAERLPYHLPRSWGSAQRSIAVAPARVAGTPRNVWVSVQGVEARRLDSPRGIAVVLLNWTGEALKQAKLHVTVRTAPTTVTSARGVKLKHQVSGSDLEVDLPLADVDVVLIE
jgi:hypothetical protein